MAECGECRLCCKLLGVPELEKPPGAWCTHCDVRGAKGCTIYEQRPGNCVEFECGWLASGGGYPEYRPDRLHMIVTGESEKIDAHVIHVDPHYPGAPDSVRGKKLLKAITSGPRKNVVLVIGDKRRYLGDGKKIAAALERVGNSLEKL